MKVIDLITLLEKFKATDEVIVLVDSKEIDIRFVERRKMDNTKFLQHKALLLTQK